MAEGDIPAQGGENEQATAADADSDAVIDAETDAGARPTDGPGLGGVEH